MKTAVVALIVQNCPAGSYNQNLDSSLDFIDRAAQKGADFIVFPEMNLTGYTAGDAILSIARPIDEHLTHLFTRKAGELNCTILIGLAEKTPDNHIYASHLVFHASGGHDVYRKIHTSPFEQTHFSAGCGFEIYESCGFRFGIQLCYDAHFPELSLAMALKDVDVIFIPHASPRGTSQEKYDSWIRHLTARAFDNGVYIAVCNQTGDNRKGLVFPGLSLLVGPDGNVLEKSVTDTEGIHRVRIERETLDAVRSHKMKYFLPNRRSDLFPI